VTVATTWVPAGPETLLNAKTVAFAGCINTNKLQQQAKSSLLQEEVMERMRLGFD
jgi:hypothetical protein